MNQGVRLNSGSRSTRTGSSQGLGKTIALLTLNHGFSDPGLRVVRLVVRKNNPRAQRLYESLRFHPDGECTELIHGEPVAFWRMAIDRETFEGADTP
ncbi:GNAT family protein [Methanoregula sp.]|uniref:GNAT family N-acetyltransferase n=1 Tax=Methanoregula sp. TaxID=2052170 RepID=UPI0025CFC04E|nr:GNAT family protein [Methanoregula sp.]